MNLRPQDVSELRRLVEDGATLPTSLPPLSLGAAIELACTAWSWGLAAQHAPLERFRGWAGQSALLGGAWKALAGERPMVAEYSAAPVDIRSVIDGVGQAFFGNRFRTIVGDVGI